MNRDQRKSHRYPFIADAEAIFASEVRPARVELLSLAGAYLVMPEPFSKGASIFVKIHTKTGVFECRATVAHSTHGTGMGVMFNDMSPGVSDGFTGMAFKGYRHIPSELSDAVNSWDHISILATALACIRALNDSGAC